MTFCPDICSPQMLVPKNHVDPLTFHPQQLKMFTYLNSYLKNTVPGMLTERITWLHPPLITSQMSCGGIAALFIFQ